MVCDWVLTLALFSSLISFCALETIKFLFWAVNGIAVLMAWVSFASLLTSILLVSGSNFDFLTAEGMFFYGLGDSGSLLFPRNAVVVGFLSSISYFFSLL